MPVGVTAKQIFDRAQLPNDVLVRIWNLADTEQRGKLSVTEFIIAMHLLASYRTGALRALPQNLPAGLYEAAARRGIPPRPASASRPTTDAPTVSAIPRQFSGTGVPRTSSPLARQPYNAPTLSSQSTGATNDWAISPKDKALYDGQFDTLDANNQSFVTGEQAVGFFSRSQLPEDDLAQIWDLADITSNGQLSRDEFAVAMHLVRQQISRKGPLPTSLPPNLVPPRMRGPQASSQAPAAPSSPPKSKSAVDDLFGLDALSAPPQVPQSTGGSSTLATPPSTQPASSPTQRAQPSTMFKQFVPTSSFGQSIVTPQQTGATPVSGSLPTSAGPVAADDDLLGDTDPEVSKKFTQETTELANLSNQVGTLTTQMKDVQTKRGSTERDLSQVGSQKRDFENRLVQLRSTYEQEAREIRTLEDQLTAARNETRKVQSDLAMVQHSLQNLQEQKQQIMAGLEADQKENANLKERMRQTNAEINQLRPHLEKMRSDARQQKGLVAINKKQLSTNEAERDKVKADLGEATNEYEEASRELEQSKRSLESVPPASTPAAAASPPPSTASMNPFFRRTATASSERGLSKSPFAPESAASPNHTAFDNFFGTSFPAPGPFTPQSGPPPTTFQKVPEPSQDDSPKDHSSTTGESPFETNDASFTQTDLPPASPPPPPPPQSRQITSSFLPLKDSTPQPASPSSSVGVVPPASRFGDTSGFTTPVKERDLSTLPIQGSIVRDAATLDASDDSKPDEHSSHVSDVSPSKHTSSLNPNEGYNISEDQTHTPHDIPGSFPGDLTPVNTSGQATPVPATPGQSHPTGASDPFDMSSPPPKAQSSAQDDFESAFAGFGNKGKAADTADAFEAPQPTSRNEFPPIQEIGGDDSDSESEKGFEDDFTASEQLHQKQLPEQDKSVATERGSDLTTERPPLPHGFSNTSELPTPSAQASPPTYNDTVSPAGQDGSRRESNQFPAEYTGLLPSREDPTTQPHSEKPDVAVQSPPNGMGASSFFDNFTSATNNANAHPSKSSGPPVPLKSAFDDFDNEFGDLSEAQAADEKVDEDFTSNREGVDEFNPTFDSPAPSKATTLRETSAFNDFESSLTGPTESATTNAPSQSAGANHDWDAMFAGLGDTSNHANGNAAGKNEDQTELFGGSEPASSKQQQQLQPPPPPLTRGLSTGTEHDDPILKRLTGMGYPRNESLAALERFDYNLDKVGCLGPVICTKKAFRSLFLLLLTRHCQAADFLTSKH